MDSEERLRGGGRRWRLSRRASWAVAASLAGCLALVVTLLPPDAPEGVRPAPGAVAQAMTAVTAGAPAALPGLAALIADREEHLRRHPRDSRAWAVLGAAYVEQGRGTFDAGNYPKAERALRASLEVRPRGNARALEGMAALAGARRDFRAARAWARAAVRVDGARWTAYPLLVDACTELGDHEGAGRALERLLELRPAASVRARTAAGVHRDRGRYEDAAAVLSDAAAGARTPAERAALLERAGQLAWERGEPEAALRHFAEAVRVDPDQRAARAGQGRALAALGREKRAVRAYRAALAGRPAPRYALELGELYESLGLEHAAREQYDVVREGVRAAAKGGADEGLVLGRFEADHGDPAAAVRRLRAQWRRQPGVEVADALGWALHRAGRGREALWFAARATDPERGAGARGAEHLYHRGMIEKALDRSGAARRHLTEALRTNPYFSPLHAPAARAALAALGEPPVRPVPRFARGPARA